MTYIIYKVYTYLLHTRIYVYATYIQDMYHNNGKINTNTIYNGRFYQNKPNHLTLNDWFCDQM